MYQVFTSGHSALGKSKKNGKGKSAGTGVTGMVTRALSSICLANACSLRPAAALRGLSMFPLASAGKTTCCPLEGNVNWILSTAMVSGPARAERPVAIRQPIAMGVVDLGARVEHRL